ncbi:hypothetical protein [Dulcicalothrix desertica]|uniref:hypothetical protein n=1 Tax=Dulcicalothrix desertica TaxID=32056 RepID=UPI00119B1E10|nr:hypothetical protein [Dulcicalothrix desertica]TWH39099.1 hypothetical protein CAL7102_08308 [Dulcicalothrix desertica PCC 7102]
MSFNVLCKRYLGVMAISFADFPVRASVLVDFGQDLNHFVILRRIKILIQLSF